MICVNVNKCLFILTIIYKQNNICINVYLLNLFLKGEVRMGETTTEKIEKKDEKKKGFGAKFMNFLMMGGFIVVLIAIVAIVVIVEMLMK